MQWFEKIYKERFSSENLSENESGLEGIDKTELWSQISQAIPQEDSIPRTPFWRRNFVILSLFTIVILGIFLFDHVSGFDKMTTENALTQQTQIQNANARNASSELQNENLPKESYENLEIENESIDKSIENTSNKTKNIESIESSVMDSDYGYSVPEQIDGTDWKKNVGHPSIRNISGSNEATISQLDNKQQALNIGLTNEKRLVETKRTSINNGPINISNSNEIFHTKIASSDSPSQEIGAAIMRQELNKQSFVAVDEIPLLELPKIQFQSLDKKTEMPKLQLAPTEIKVSKSPSPWAIILNSNINRLDLNYTDVGIGESFASQANQSIEESKSGYGFGAYLSYSFNDNWQVSSGFESNKYKNQLNAIISKDTFALDENQIIRKAQEIRTIRHTNRVSVFTIPINVSFEYTLKSRVGLGASLGASYSFVTSQSGRLLARENSVIDFDQKNNRQLRNYLSTRFSPYLKYRLTKEFEVMLNFGISMQNHGTSTELGLNQKSRISSCGIGLKYNLR